MVLACFSSLEPDFVHRFANALICARRRENLPKIREREGGGESTTYCHTLDVFIE